MDKLLHQSQSWCSVPYTVVSFRISRGTCNFLAQKLLYITQEIIFKKIEAFFEKKYFSTRNSWEGPLDFGQLSYKQFKMGFVCAEAVLFCSEMVVYHLENHIWEGKAFSKKNVFDDKAWGIPAHIFSGNCFFEKYFRPYIIRGSLIHRSRIASHFFPKYNLDAKKPDFRPKTWVLRNL
jgi:hypothetical protein